MQTQDTRLWKADNLDGTYNNPILYADYSDPDAIRVGDTYYLTASSFNYIPGLPILTSKDLVNWELVNYALKRIPEASYDQPRHACGVWAPSIRYHKGMFYIYYGMPDEGIFVVRTTDPLGEWEAPVLVREGKGLIDPCPLFLDDGSVYLVHAYAKSRIGFNSVLAVFPLSEDGLKATGESVIVFDGHGSHPTIEGPKFYQRNGYFYIFAPAGGVGNGWQTVLRSEKIYGPYEDRIVLAQNDTPVNGPHQGALISAPDETEWFLHFQLTPVHGRILHLQPAHWTKDGWPVLGNNGIPCLRYEKPFSSQEVVPCYSDFSDNFDGQKLSLGWQWTANPSESFYTIKDSALLLHSLHYGNDLFQYPNLLTQMLICPEYRASVTLDYSGLNQGERAGLLLLGKTYVYIAVEHTPEGFCLVSNCGEAPFRAVLPAGNRLIRLSVGGDRFGSYTFSYKKTGSDSYISLPVNPQSPLSGHTWVGTRIGLFACSDTENGVPGFGRFSNYISEASLK